MPVASMKLFQKMSHQIKLTTDSIIVGYIIFVSAIIIIIIIFIIIIIITFSVPEAVYYQKVKKSNNFIIVTWWNAGITGQLYYILSYFLYFFSTFLYLNTII